jgi:hypothetical protein
MIHTARYSVSDLLNIVEHLAVVGLACDIRSLIVEYSGVLSIEVDDMHIDVNTRVYRTHLSSQPPPVSFGLDSSISVYIDIHVLSASIDLPCIGGGYKAYPRVLTGSGY